MTLSGVAVLEYHRQGRWLFIINKLLSGMNFAELLSTQDALDFREFSGEKRDLNSKPKRRNRNAISDQKRSHSDDGPTYW
jgi:hypothetical protein